MGVGVSAHGLCYDVGGVRVLTDVSLEAPSGAVTALTGPSGCGKTTLLGCLSGLLRPASGSVVIDGVPTARWKERDVLRFWRDRAAFVYQDHGIISDETVAFNISFIRPRYLWRRKAVPERVRECLRTVGLDHRATELASHLSGGERQRVGIARALYREATYLFVDEPTASLDADNRRVVLDLLRLAAGRGATVLMATHDTEAMEAADRVVLLPATAAQR